MRGRQLTYSGDMRTRPMKDRVRESVFNLLGPRIVGTHAIDLFAGTGALGLEAISRGSVRATLIERHLPTCKLIEANARELEVSDVAEVVFGDAFIWGRRLKAQMPPAMTSGSPWAVFCSPPFDFYVDRRDDMLALIEQLHSAAPEGSLFMIEADERFDLQQLTTPDAWDVRHYLPSIVAVLAKE